MKKNYWFCVETIPMFSNEIQDKNETAESWLFLHEFFFTKILQDWNLFFYQYHTKIFSSHFFFVLKFYILCCCVLKHWILDEGDAARLRFMNKLAEKIFAKCLYILNLVHSWTDNSRPLELVISKSPAWIRQCQQKVSSKHTKCIDGKWAPFLYLFTRDYQNEMHFRFRLNVISSAHLRAQS